MRILYGFLWTVIVAVAPSWAAEPMLPKPPQEAPKSAHTDEIVTFEEVPEAYETRTETIDGKQVTVEVHQIPKYIRKVSYPAAYQTQTGGVVNPPTAIAAEFWADPEVKRQYKDWIIRGYADEIAKREENASVLYWTNKIGYLIFFMVSLSCGIAFKVALNEIGQAEVRRSSAKQAGHATEVSVGLEKIALKTSMNGLILLGMTVGLYLIYIKYVWPISIIK